MARRMRTLESGMDVSIFSGFLGPAGTGARLPAASLYCVARHE